MMNHENSEILLETKYIGDIRGNFHIPSFQRGYRWGKDQVTRLLDDIYINGPKNYSLQPIVVKRRGNDYELIDGQQRLTTLYLLYHYLHTTSTGFFDEPSFSLHYETREKSQAFLQSMDPGLKDDNIDYWFMTEAYEVIQDWFNHHDKKSTLTNINKYLDENVKVIWYEVDESADSISLFTRLNIGKIPLTSAELVKAMFLSRDSQPEMDREKQEEISLQWDNIEKALHQDSLWYFLTNHTKIRYQTRIDLILDLIADKTLENKDTYHTFFHFDALRQREELQDIWKEIQHTFLILKDWHENHELYHKIGYLIASGTRSLKEILEISKREENGQGITKKAFKAELDNSIRKSITIAANYGELSYEKTSDYAKIYRLLLLFNIESVRQNGERTQWFPFERYKSHESRKSSWSLEHIHAQQSEGMKRQEDWKEWLTLHLDSVRAVQGEGEELVDEMLKALRRQHLDRRDFEEIQRRVLEKLSAEGSTLYLNSIANLALLNMKDNAALNNSTFDVKRTAIIERDRKGQFIPFCTKMVFLKYYTPSKGNQLHFWGQMDRDAYIQAINSTLDSYLEEKITIGEGV